MKSVQYGVKNLSASETLRKQAPLMLGATALAIGAAVPAGLAYFFLHPPRQFHRKNPKSALGLAYERVRFRAEDGIILRGWYVPAKQQPKGVVVVSHGYFGNREMMLPYLAFLHHGGYSALLYDFRAHGWSNGRRASFGIHEPKDLQAAVQWTQEHPDLRHLPLFLFGESMGAAVSLLVAAQQSAVQAVVADSPYARFDNAVEGRIRSLLGKPAAVMLAPSAQRAGERLLGVKCTEIAPIEAVPQILPRPIHLIHGLEDRFIVPGNSRLIHAIAPEQITLWEVPRARHVCSVYVAPDEYAERVLAFLDQVTM